MTHRMDDWPLEHTCNMMISRSSITRELRLEYEPQSTHRYPFKKIVYTGRSLQTRLRYVVPQCPRGTQRYWYSQLAFQCSLDFPSDFLDLGGPWGRPTSRSRGKMITWAEMPLTFVAKWMSCQIHTWKKTCLSLTKIRTL